jgi:HD-like signal output (HDOD) protein
MVAAVLLGVLVVAAVTIWLFSRARPPASAAPPPTAPRAPAPEPPARAEPQTSAALSAPTIFRRLQEMGFRESIAAPEQAPAGLEAEVAAVLESVATQPRYAPRRPLLLPQLLRAVNDDQVSRRELAQIIARDPALAGSLLKLANSAFFRVDERPVESIDRAVALLGTDGIRSLVAAVLVQPVFQLAATQFPHFPELVWEYTYRAASAAEAHAAIVEDSDPFAAQLLGLTMGLGSIVVFRVALDQYAARSVAPQAAVIARLLDAHAAAVARRIAASWELSDRILSALADQIPGEVPHLVSSLGRSLYFGRLIGALAVLRANEGVSDEVAKASMMAAGASSSQFERIWTRLTAPAAKDAKKKA